MSSGPLSAHACNSTYAEAAGGRQQAAGSRHQADAAAKGKRQRTAVRHKDDKVEK